jgi:hypothetical protein
MYIDDGGGNAGRMNTNAKRPGRPGVHQSSGRS